MQRPIVLPYTPNGVALGLKSRYATLSGRCICEPCLWPIRQRLWLSNATPKMHCIIPIMQHHCFIKATSTGVAPKSEHTAEVGPTSSATSAGSLSHVTWHVSWVHLPHHWWVTCHVMGGSHRIQTFSGFHIAFATPYILICNTKLFIFATLIN